MCNFNAGLRLNQNVSLWKNQSQCLRLWGSKTGNIEVISPASKENREKTFAKKVMTHSLAKGELKITVWTELQSCHFWDAAT